MIGQGIEPGIPKFVTSPSFAATETTVPLILSRKTAIIMIIVIIWMMMMIVIIINFIVSITFNIIIMVRQRVERIAGTNVSYIPCTTTTMFPVMQWLLHHTVVIIAATMTHRSDAIMDRIGIVVIPIE